MNQFQRESLDRFWYRFMREVLDFCYVHGTTGSEVFAEFAKRCQEMCVCKPEDIEAIEVNTKELLQNYFKEFLKKY